MKWVNGVGWVGSAAQPTAAADPISPQSAPVRRLRELEAHFVKLVLEAANEHWPLGAPTIHAVKSLPEADGVWFLCPLCFTRNGGSMGTHMVGCWFRGRVPDWVDPKPGRWTPFGTGIDDLTFVPPPASISVFLTSGCMWHGHIKQGAATA